MSKREKIGGIYCIYNTYNKRVYIGRSLDVVKRFQTHYRDLRKEEHANLFLQRDYNIYGPSVFKCLVLEDLSSSSENEMVAVEQECLDSMDNLYNLSENAYYGGDLISNHPEHERICQRQREIASEKFSSWTEEDHQAWSERFKGEKNPNYGNKWSKEQKEKASKFWKEKYANGYVSPSLGKKLTEERRRNMSEARKGRFCGKDNPFYGKTHTKEAREKISKNNLGKKPPNRKKISINGEIYESATEAHRQLGIPTVTVAWRANCKHNDKFKDWFYLSD